MKSVLNLLQAAILMNSLKNSPWLQVSHGEEDKTLIISTMMAQRALQKKITEFLNNEGAAVILNNSGTFNVPRSNGAKYTAGSPEPVAELNLPVEAHGRMERLLRHNIPVEMEVEIINKFFQQPYSL